MGRGLFSDSDTGKYPRVMRCIAVLVRSMEAVMETPIAEGDGSPPLPAGVAVNRGVDAGTSLVKKEAVVADAPADEACHAEDTHASALADHPQNHRPLVEGEHMAQTRQDCERELFASLSAARLAREQGDVDSALAHFGVAASLEVQGVEARLALGEYLLALHANDRAESVLKEVANIDPRRPEPFEGLAEIARRRGDRGAAIGIISVAVRELPENEQLTLRLVEDLAGLRRFDEAEKCLAMLAATAVPSSSALRAGARLAISAGALARGIERHRSANDACSSDVRGYVEMALLLLMCGRLDDADILLKQAREHDPHDVRYLAAARFHARRRQRCNDLSRATSVVGVLPGDPLAARSVVEQLRSDGHHDEAEAFVERWTVGRRPDYGLLI